MLVNGVEFTIGADPEVFAANKEGFVSAHNLVPGTKSEPYAVPSGAVQVDGMALEFNINPTDNFEAFNNNLSSVMSTLQEMIGDHDLMTDASVRFDKEFLSDVPTSALELGCEPDFDAYTGAVNEKPDAGMLMRTAGGHIHIGDGRWYDDPMNEGRMSFGSKLARILDETVGLPSLVWDQDDERRSLYGKSGAFRPKSFGMEYRTPSNSWIFTKKTRLLVFQGVCDALEKVFIPNYRPDGIVRKIIDNSDRSSSFFNNHPSVMRAKEVLS